MWVNFHFLSKISQRSDTFNSHSLFLYFFVDAQIYSNDSKCGVCCVLWRRNQISSPFIPQRRIHFSLSQKKMFCLYNYFHDGCWWWFIMTIPSFFKEKKKIENEEEVRRVFVYISVYSCCMSWEIFNNSTEKKNWK